MKSTLEFDLENENDAMWYEVQPQMKNMYFFIWQLRINLLKKYRDSENEEVEELIKEIDDMAEEYGISGYFLNIVP